MWEGCIFFWYDFLNVFAVRKLHTKLDRLFQLKLLPSEWAQLQSVSQEQATTLLKQAVGDKARLHHVHPSSINCTIQHESNITKSPHQAAAHRHTLLLFFRFVSSFSYSLFRSLFWRVSSRIFVSNKNLGGEIICGHTLISSCIHIAKSERNIF